MNTNSTTENSGRPGWPPATSCSSPPPAKPGWDHSERVLVCYQHIGTKEESFSIAYYHHKPPFKEKGAWVDWLHAGKETPSWWWPLPPVKPIA